jgi:hypothetical protein
MKNVNHYEFQITDGVFTAARPKKYRNIISNDLVKQHQTGAFANVELNEFPKKTEERSTSAVMVNSCPSPEAKHMELIG